MPAPQLMDCPHCGAPCWIDGARRCVDCGGSLLPADRPPLSDLASPSWVSCPRCDADNSETESACVRCGAELMVSTLFELKGAALRRRLVALVGIGVTLSERQGQLAARFRRTLEDAE